MLVTLLVMLVVLGVVIFVHELGHFMAAKWFGVQVLRFSIGFGPPILSWQRGETEYWIASIPLGGYVKMAGMEEEGDPTGRLEGGAASVPIDPARTLESKPVWARLIVMVAGVTMNVLLAFLIHTGINAVAAPEPAMLPIDSVAVDSLSPEASALAQLKPGDRIVAINGDTVRSLRDFQQAIEEGPDTLRLRQDASAEPLIVPLPADRAERRAAFQAISFRLPPTVSILIPGDPAHRAGLKPGDQVLSVNGDTVASWSELVSMIRRSAGDSLQMAVRRGEQRLEVTVVPKEHTERGPDGVERTYGLIGANPNPPIVYVPQPLGTAVIEGARETAVRAGMVVVFLSRLFTGGVSVREVGGPVLIAQLSGQAAQLGLVTLLGFVAFISLNLAVLNLLPIPVLDGGHVMFLLFEAVRGKPVSQKVRLRLTQAGFAFIVALMVLAFSNDVLRNISR
jgi:regulator of sigma E protease